MRAMTATSPRFSLYEHIVESTSEGAWVIDAASITTFVNKSMAEMLGRTREEMVGTHFLDMMADEGRNAAAANIERRKQGLAETFEFVFQHKNGSAVWTRVVTSPMHDEAGTYVGAFALVTDLTRERLNTAEGERLWQIVGESLNEIYLFRRDDLRFTYANRGALVNLGYTMEQLREMTPPSIQPSHDRTAFAAVIAPLLGRVVDKVVFQTVHRRRNGTDYPVEVHLQFSAGGGDMIVAFVNDISERIEADRVLRANEARFRSLIEESPDLLMLFDGNGCFTFLSPSVTTILGFTPAELIGRPGRELVHPEDLEGADRALAAVPGGTAAVVESRMRHRDGSWRTLVSRVRNHLDNPGINAVVSNARDVTAERKMEERFRHAQHLGSIGRLAGGVAHDFNNILTAIIGSASFLDEDKSLSAVAREDVREILRSGARASDLTSQLLAFASKRVIQPHNVDVGALIRNQDRFLRRVIGEQINLRSQVDDNLWPVLADPTQLEQVILNLAVNARDAMPDGGHITLEVHNIVLDEAYADGHADVEAGPWVVIAVSDTGVGIPPDILEHIFEPFFTTKKSGAGTGLGLATVYGVVRQCNGHISVYSEPGIGTTFKVYLPRSPSDTPWVETPPRAVARDGNERVLIVEDEADVRRMVLRALESAGYLAYAEATPLAALAWIRAHQGAVDLMITDVVMPEMNGKQLATMVQAEFPDVRVLYISGYTENTIVHRGVLEAGVEFLAKPFSPADVRRRVRAVIDRPAETTEPSTDSPS